MYMHPLDPIFKPKSVAVIGASREPYAIGYSVVKNLLTTRYEGKIYPINPKADEILGLKCYHSILDVPDPVDLAVVTVPAKITPIVVEEAGKKGVVGLAVISSGFSEVGDIALEDQIVNIAKKYKMRILGPNIVGLMNNPLKMNASFAPYLPYPGKIAMISQSGALLIALNSRTWLDRVGMSHLISIGNMADLDFATLIEYFSGDDQTSCISLYIEGIKNGKDFIEASKKVIDKPIVALKAGVSKRGAMAAASHTGSLAGSSKIYDSAFKQAGIIKATDLNDLFDKSLALASQPPMHGENLLIITNGGGIGVLATDAAEKNDLQVKDPPDDLKEKIKKIIPDFGSTKNPIDLTGMANDEWYKNSLSAALEDPWVSGIIILYCEVAVLDPKDLAAAVNEVVSCSKTSKPITIALVGGEQSMRAAEWLQKKGIPVYQSPDRAIKAMAALRDFGKIKETGFDIFGPYKDVDKDKVNVILTEVNKRKNRYVTELEAKQIFEAYKIPTAKSMLAKTEEEAVNLANQIGYPVVMKIVSPQIIHKSDVGGVKINIKTDDEVRKAYNQIIINVSKIDPKPEILGILVQEMAPSGTECIIGSTQDPQFGATVMFGLGGVFVEVLKDVSFRITPFSNNTAKQLIDEIEGRAILYGARGEKSKDIDALANAISRFSQLVEEFPILKEVDANPTILYEKGLKVVDARIIL
jgi:acetyltransferase